LTGFSDHLPDLDAAIAEHLGDVGEVRPFDGSPVITGVHVILEIPSEGETAGKGVVVVQRPTAELPVAEVEKLARGDVIAVLGRVWRVNGAPARPGDARWWRATVEDTGPA
jgi:hypothetical protein